MLPFMLKIRICIYSLQRHSISPETYGRNWLKSWLRGKGLVTREEKRDWDLTFTVHTLYLVNILPNACVIN